MAHASPDPACECPELARLRGSVTALAEIFTQLIAAEAPAPGRTELRLASEQR